jgi:hypothetical protein
MQTRAHKIWYHVCSEVDCMKKFAKDYDSIHMTHDKEKTLLTPKDKYNSILLSLFSTNLYCMTCSHKHAHRVYYNVGNPEPYNIDFLRV